MTRLREALPFELSFDNNAAGDKLPAETEPQETPVVEQPPPVQVAPPDSVGIAPQIEEPAQPEQTVRPPVRFDREKVSWTVVVASYLEQASADTAAVQYPKQLYRTPKDVDADIDEGEQNRGWRQPA